MEVFILDSLLRRSQVVDKFESLIWTERFSEIGDFELDLKSTLEARGQFHYWYSSSHQQLVPGNDGGDCRGYHRH
jgi:hypothetical protein